MRGSAPVIGFEFYIDWHCDLMLGSMDPEHSVYL